MFGADSGKCTFVQTFFKIRSLSFGIGTLKFRSLDQILSFCKLRQLYLVQVLISVELHQFTTAELLAHSFILFILRVC